MSVVFALIKLTVPVIDPQTRKLVGENLKEVTKGFDGSAELNDVREWALKNKATSCSLMFETEE